MEAFLIYLLKTSGLLLLFYGAYILLLQRETFFKANRWFLIGGMVLALVLPLVSITVTEQQVLPATVMGEIQEVKEAGFIENSISWSAILFGLYGMGLLLMVLRLLLEASSLYRLLAPLSKSKNGGLFYAETSQDVPAFSFFKYIVYNPDHYKKEDLQGILRHERVHSLQYHSVDVLFAKLLTLLLWFNPVVWWYRKALVQNLEFLADKSAAEGISDKSAYQYSLLQDVCVAPTVSFINSFYNKSLIKKRIVMLQQSESKTRNLFKMAVVLPVLALFLMAFNTHTEVQYLPQDPKSGELLERMEVFLVTADMTQADLDRMVARAKAKDIQIKFRGVKRNAAGEIIGLEVDVKAAGSKASYAHTNDEGKAIEAIFIKVDPETNFVSIGNESNQNKMEHVRVVGYGNTDKDVDVQSVWITKEEEDKDHVIVIEEVDGKRQIKVDGKEVTQEELDAIHAENIHAIHVSKGKDGNSSGQNVFRIRGVQKGGGEPLYILDGKEISKKDMEALSPSEIKSMNVLKGDKATEQYGDKGKNGVIQIKTKK